MSRTPRPARSAGLLATVVVCLMALAGAAVVGLMPGVAAATTGASARSPSEPSPSSMPSGPTLSEPTAEPSPSPPPSASVGPPLVDLRATPDPVSGANPEAAASTPSPASVDGVPDAVDIETAQGIVAEIHRDAEDDGEVPDLLGNLLGRSGSIVWHHHDLGAGVHMFEHIFSHQARLLFSAGLWVVAFASWLLDFVLRFDIGYWLAGDVGSVTSGYADLLKEGWGGALTTLMYVLAMAHAGWQILRHRGQAAIAELMVALIIAFVGGFLVDNADRAACVGLGVMADLTVGTIALTASDGAEDVSERHDYCEGTPEDHEHLRSTAPLGFEDPLLQTFVTDPFLLLQWGRVPAPGTSCRMVADALIATGPWGDDSYPREKMREAKCDDMASFNDDITVERVTGAAVYMLSAWAFAAAVILTAGTLLAAQVAGALLVVTMPFAVVLGISPGAGREVLARWGHGVLKVGVLFVGSAFFLAIMTTAVGAVQRGSGERSLLIRMLASIVVAWSLVIMRGRLFKSMRRASHSVASRVAGPGSDVGGVARSPSGVVGGGVVRAAEGAMYLHGGAVALKAGVAAAGTAGASAAAAGSQTGAVAGGLVASGRQGRLLLANRWAAARRPDSDRPASGAADRDGS